MLSSALRESEIVLLGEEDDNSRITLLGAGSLDVSALFCVAEENEDEDDDEERLCIRVSIS